MGEPHLVVVGQVCPHHSLNALVLGRSSVCVVGHRPPAEGAEEGCSAVHGSAVYTGMFTINLGECFPLFIGVVRR